MKVKKSSVPGIDPCGTPFVIRRKSDWRELTEKVLITIGQRGSEIAQSDPSHTKILLLF